MEDIWLEATVSGEMQPADIPATTGIDIEALKEGDTNPMEVVVEVPAGKSKRGWNYRPESLQRIVETVAQKGLHGFLGHQKPENIADEFPPPVTHWVGARWQDGKAYFRGVIDKSATHLKRWLKSKTVNTVSIYGRPKLKQVAGETHVVDYVPLSIDWTPLGRAGMPTRVVSIGEMEDEKSGGEEKMNWKELMAKIKTMAATGEVTNAQIVGEMGWDAKEVAGEIDANWLKKVNEAVEIVDKTKKVLGVTGEMDIVQVAAVAAKAVAGQREAEHIKLVEDVVKEKVTGEMAQKLVRRILRVQKDATKEQVAGEIDALVKDEEIKKMLAQLHIDNPAATAGANTQHGMKTKRVSI